MSTLFGIGRLLLRRFSEQQMTHHAAALTYYSILALFPGLLALVSLLGLLGSAETVEQAAAWLRDAGADAAMIDAVTSSTRNAVDANASAAAVSFLAGLAIALNGASGAFEAAGRALNIVHESTDTRGIVERRLRAIGSTLAVIALVMLASVCVALGGDVASVLAQSLELGAVAETVWALVRWPLAFAFAAAAFSWVYFAAPHVPDHRFRPLSAGAALGVSIWICASGLLFVYAANFADYNATYGVFASAILLLLWLWLTNVALLLGAELDAVLRLRAGQTPPRTVTGQGTAGPGTETPDERSAAAQDYQLAGQRDPSAAHRDPRTGLARSLKP